MIYELQDYDLYKEKVFDNGSAILDRSNFHFTYCREHLQPAVMSHKRHLEAGEGLLHLTLSLDGAMVGDSLEIPKCNDLPRTVFMCPAMIKGACEHVYVLLLGKQTSANTTATFVVDRKGLLLSLKSKNNV